MTHMFLFRGGALYVRSLEGCNDRRLRTQLVRQHEAGPSPLNQMNCT
jgi:hypothetical protein